jgi:hypothetical protein
MGGAEGVYLDKKCGYTKRPTKNLVVANTFSFKNRRNEPFFDKVLKKT